MKKTLLCLGAFVALTGSTLLSEASAKTRSIQISITDQGFVPSRVVAILNQQTNIHIVNQGHKVHQFSIPYYRIFTETLKPGASSDVSFSPWTAGQFDMISDPTGTNTAEFSGKFVVTDAK